MEKGPAKRPALPPLPACCVLSYPFVTTGGGGVAQPAILARASTAMIAKASFFIGVFPRAMDARTIRKGHGGALVPKSHSGHVSDGRAGSLATIGANVSFSRPWMANSRAIAGCAAYFCLWFSTEVTSSHSADDRSCLWAETTAGSNRSSQGESRRPIARRSRLNAACDRDEFSEGLTPFVHNVHGGRIPESSFEGPAASQSQPARELSLSQRINSCVGMDDPCK